MQLIRIIKKSLGIAILLLATQIGFAQLIGTYTIGGTSPKFATISEAVDSLETYGVSGSVTFHIRPGTYTEQVDYDSIPGVTATNNVTFKTEPGSSSFAELKTSGSYFFAFDTGAAFVTIDSLYMHQPSYGNVVYLRGINRNISITNCELRGSHSSYGYDAYALIQDNIGRNTFNFTFKDNHTIGGAGILYLRGLNDTLLDSNIVIENNLSDSAATGYFFRYATAGNFENNVINLDPSNTNSYGHGIYFYGVHEIDIVNNQIISWSEMSTDEFFLYDCSGTFANKTIVANNLIVEKVKSYSNSRVGYFILCKYMDIVHNTFIGKKYNASSFCYLAGTSTQTSFKNNCVYNAGSAVAMAVSSGGASLSNNNFYGNNGISNFASTVSNTNGITVNPDVDPLNDYKSKSPVLAGKGTPIATVIKDLEGVTRSGSAPHIGVYELTFPTNDAGIASTVIDKICSVSQPIKVLVRNYGSNTITSLTVKWAISTNGGVYVSQNDASLLHSISSAADTLITLGNFTLVVGNSYSIKTYTTGPSSGTDNNNSNDTAQAGFSAGMTGDYTIGGTSPSYSSMSLAVADLNKYGVCGPVNFKIRAGTYFEQIDFESIEGVGLVNSISVKPDAGAYSSVFLNFDSGYVAGFGEGSNFITFDSLEMGMSGAGNVVRIYGQSENLTFSNCILNGAITTSTSSTNDVLIVVDGTSCNHLSITDNVIKNGAKGISLGGSNSGAIVTNAHVLRNEILYPYYRGIHFLRTDSCKINYNKIRINTDHPDATGIETVSIYVCDVIGNDIVVRAADYAQGVDLWIYSKCLFANNMVSIPKPSSHQQNHSRIRYSNGIKIINNNFFGRHQDSSESIFEIDDFYNDMVLKNNCFVNDGDGYALELTNTPTRSNNNFYGGSGTRNVLGTAQGANGLNVDPFYLSDTNLHVQCGALKGQAVADTDLPLDFDGDTRHASNPDIGADEVSLNSVDVAINEITTNGGCAGGSASVYVDLRNVGVNTITSVTINWSLSTNGGAYVAQTPINYSGSLVACDDSLISVGSFTSVVGNSYKVVAYTSSPNSTTDGNNDNDSLISDLSISLKGTYTIGGNLPSYSTFQEAIDGLNEFGVCGPVVFHVRSSIYNEKITIEEIDGTSITNTVTFKSDPANATMPILTDSSSDFLENYTLRFSGTRNVILDSLNIIALGVQYGTAISFENYNYDITIKSCQIEGPTTSNTGQYMAVIKDEFSLKDSLENIEISNNLIKNGSIGIYLRGHWNDRENDIRISDNEIDSFSFVGIRLYWVTGATLDGNLIKNRSTSYSVIGIDAYFYDSLIISSNRINLQGTSGGNGMMLNNPDTISGKASKVVNNEIAFSDAFNSGRWYGIRTVNSDFEIYNNSIHKESGINNDYGMFLEAGQGSHYKIYNNIISDKTGGYLFYFSDLTGIDSCDYNVLYRSGAGSFTYGPSYNSNLANHRTNTGFGVHSATINPNFTALDSLYPTNAAIDGAGFYLSEVPNDINGTIRSTTLPDIGAYEITIPPLAGIYTIGGTTPDYPTLDSAAMDLNARGISAAVTFLIRPDTYVEHMFVDTIIGADSSKLVTFRNDTNFTGTVLIKDSLTKDNPGLFTFKNSGYVKIIGLNFEEDGLSVNTSSCIRLEGLCTDFYVDSCNFKANSSNFNNYYRSAIGTGESHVEISTDYPSGMTYQSERMEISNSTMVGFGYPVNINGRSTHFILADSPVGKVINCTMTGVSNYSFFGSHLDTLVFSSSEVSGSSLLLSLTGNKSVTIDKNKFFSVGDNHVSFLSGLGNLVSASNPILITNNVFRSERSASTSQRIGFNIRSDDHYSFFNNTIYLETNIEDTAHHKVFSVNDVKNLNFKNNNVIFNGTNGYVYDLDRPSGHNYDLDYNNVYSKSGSIGLLGGVEYPTLDSLHTLGYDFSSLSLNPRFNNDTLLEPHVTELVDAGDSISDITDDILGVSRDGTPSIGAYEYSYTCGGLSGTYTVGGTTPDYSSIAAAVEDINEVGICDDVTFNIRQGTYTGSYKLEKVYNSPDSGKIVFRDDPSNTLEAILYDNLDSNVNPYLLEIGEVSNIEFRNLTFKAKGNGQSAILFLNDSVRNLTVDSCTFDALNESSGLINAGSWPNKVFVDSILITNNRFLNTRAGAPDGRGAVSILAQNDSNYPRYGNYTLVQNNLFNNCYKSVYLNNHSYLEILDNTIIDGFDGIGISTSAFQIRRNKIFISNKGVNIDGDNSSLTNYIINNVISSESSSAISNTHVTTKRCEISHNTLISNAADFPVLQYGNAWGTSSQKLVLKNNILYHTNSGNVIEVKGNASDLIYEGDYNNLYTDGDTLVKTNDSSATTLAEFISYAQVDSNSVSVNPYFLSDTLLKPYRAAMNDSGISITGITADIESVLRGTPPDIGAYQFDPIVFDVQVDSIALDTLCAGLFEVKALVKNVGDSTVKKVAFNWTVTAASSVTSLDTTAYYSGTLAKNDTAWVTLGKFNFIGSTDYEIEVDADTIEGSQNIGYLDNTPQNNLVFDTFSIRAIPLSNFVVQKACLSDSIILIASGGINYVWSGPNSFTNTGDTVIRLFSDTNMIGAYTLTAFDSLGCSADYTNTFAMDSAIIVRLPADDSICGSTSFTLSANENTQYAYLWNNGETTPQIVVDSTFEYILRVTDQNNCVNADTFNLTVYSDPIVAFDSTIQAACSFGNPIILNHAKPAGAGGIYTGSGSVSYISRDTLTPQGSGNYPVKYTYTDTNGCSGFADTVLIVYKRPSVALSTFTDLCINEAPYFISENSPVDTISGIFAGIGIVNDSIGIFDPAVADTGTHTIYYTYTDTSTGCSSVDSNTITVNDTFNIAFTAADYCINDGKVTLSKPSGIVSSYSSYYLDTNANNAVFGTHGFNPFIADTGIQTLKYTVVNDDNCTSIAYRDITVNGIPVVSLQLDTFCVNAPSEMMAGGLPTGGTYYYGVGVGSGTYYPDSAGVGLDTINYRFTQSNGCSDTAEAVFLIRQIPVVTFELPSFSTERCVDAIPFAFTGHSPVTAAAFGKGIFSILGDSVNQFEASVNGVGTHVVQFKYTDQFGCADSTSDSVIVHAIPQPAFTTPFSRICLNQIPDTVFASPFGVGGVFSGVGIDSSGYFNPSIVGADSNKTLTYTYTDTNGCSDFVVDTFIVDSVPSITLALIPDQCLNGVEYTFTEGKFNTGAHYVSTKLDTLIGGKYSPILADTGIDKITYIYTDGVGCSDSLSQNITVLDTTVVTFSISTVRAEVCENEVTFNLSSAKPIGGIYTGKGLVGNKFTPANADLGNNFITYAYTNGGNCKSVIIDTIKVNAITPVTYADQTFCLNDDTTIIRGGTPTIGIYKYSGGGMISDSLFVPSAAGTGPRTMTYALTNSDGCISQASATFTINSVPSTQFGAQAAICLNVAEISLRNASTSGDTSYFYNSTGLTNAATGKYLPAQSGVGLDTLGYVGINSSTGCADSIFNTILVHAIPVTTLDTFPDYCINNVPIALSKGNPKTGGTGIYSGKGIVGTQFYASIAKAGSHDIVYRFTDNNNCSTSDTEIVVINALPILTAVSLADLCLFDTTIILSGALPIGGIYSGVNVDSASAVFSPDSIGIWNIKYNYIDTNGCENDITQTQRVRALPAAQLNFSNKFCDNATPLALNGGSPIGVGGAYGGQGVAGTLYDPSLVTALIDTLVYSYTDTYGCENTDTVFVFFDSSAIITAIPLPDICKGTAVLDLSAYYSPLGGTYKGANVFGSNFNANLLDTGRFAMSYTYTDSNNCTTAAYDTVVILPLPDIQVSSDTGICQGDKIQLMVSGNYGYNWSNGDYLSTIQVSPLKTLSYSVTATNSFNCVVSKNIGVTVFDQISVFTSSVNASCNQANGTAFTSVAGGVKPYNYLWSTGQRSSNSRQLFAGNYQVTVNDKNGCTQYGVVGISNEDGPQVTVTSLVHNTCAGNESGEIEVSVSNDTAYTIQWNNGTTGTKLTNLKSGIYELSVIGADGCSSFKSIEIKSPKAYEYQSIVEQPDCDSANGSIYLQLTNSLDSVTYTWVNQPVGDTLNSIRAGIYNVAVSNKLGCIDTVTLSLNTATAPRIKLDSIQFVDCNQSNGLLGVSGIDLISNFNWSNGDTTAIINNLSIGSYVITASDTSGCSTIEQFDVEGKKPTVPVICKVTNDSLIFANVLVWDTTGSTADSFYVYRESSVRNQYFKMATFGRSQAPRFEDNSFTNWSSIGSYSVVAIDACKSESEFSPVHKAILLSAKQTDSTLIELSWSNYQGSVFGDYYAYRYSSQFGLQLLDSINGINSFIDYNVPNNSTVLYYYVGIKGLTNCGDVGISTISNLSRDFGMKLVGISSKVQEEVSFLVWPNPSNGSFQIKLTGLDTYGGQLIVYDIHGKIRYQNGIDSSLQGSTQSVILPEISSGLYYVQFIQNETVITREIIVNR